MRAPLRWLTLLALGLCARPALAQVVDPELFGDGHLPVFREEETDRRFLKTGIYTALNDGPQEPACKRVVATLLVAYAESLLYLHRKDQNFYCDPQLLQTLNQSISSRDFPATAYLAAMIRRTMIDKKVPAAWLATATKLRDELQAPIATGRMQLFSGGLQPIDSFGFTVPTLLDRYAREVKLAPSIALDSAEERFRDKYMDRDITWGGLVLADIAKEAPPPPPKKGKGKGRGKKEAQLAAAPAELHTWAVVGYPLGKPAQGVPGLTAPVQVAQLEIRARLKDDQVLDMTKFIRGSRVLIKGHLWDVAPNMAWVEVRDAYLFPDPNWATWTGTASPNDVIQCPIAVNDLSPYGVKERKQQFKAPNPYDHTQQ